MTNASGDYRVMSLKDADERVEQYVQGSIAQLDHNNFANPEMTIDQYAALLRKECYDFLMAHFLLIEEGTPIEETVD